jgi:hypothetical protein
MDIFEYMNHGKISSLLEQFNICESCGVVDTLADRMVVGTLCPDCHTPSKCAYTYFHLSLLGIVDLIQEAYERIPENSPTSSYSINIPGSAHCTSVVIFYCVLREALLERLIEELMSFQYLSDNLRERLTKDYASHYDRLFKLFPALTGVSWDEALKCVHSETGKDFGPISNTLKEMADARNRFIHETNIYSINRDTAKQCIESIYGTFELFVELHNLLVHPKHKKDRTAAP